MAAKKLPFARATNMRKKNPRQAQKQRLKKQRPRGFGAMAAANKPRRMY